MSNDIFYTNISNLVTFYMGERPSADKFNAVNKYFSRGMRELAGAIGDIYDDGFPYIGDSGELGPKWNVYSADNNYKRLLDIVSLGRLIGPASNLNSRMHLSYGSSSEMITETIPAGSTSYKLLHPQSSLIGINNNYFEVNNNSVNTYFTETNEYKLINGREIIFSAPTVNELTVTYSTTPSRYFGGADYENAGFNVIPDPNQDRGVQIEELEGRKYKITFPGIIKQQSGLLNLKDSGVDTAHDFNNAKNYELPKWLIDSITDDNGNIIDENRIIPGNFLYLKNRRTQEVYRDAIYEYESPNSIIASNIDLCVEENGAYSTSDYCVILTGTNITNMLDDLRLKWFKHSHDGEFGESPIQFKSLVGKFADIPTSGVYGPSGNDWNQMPMYLHRDGYGADSNLNNGDNAMRGPLAMGLVRFDPLDPVTSSIISEDAGSGNSHPIYFGGVSCKIERVGLNFEISQGLTADLMITSGQDIDIIADRNVNVAGVWVEIKGSDYIVLKDDDGQSYLEVLPNNQYGKKLILNKTIEITKFSPESLSPEGVTEDFQFGNLSPRTDYKVERNVSTWSKDIDTTKIVFDLLPNYINNGMEVDNYDSNNSTYTLSNGLKIIKRKSDFVRDWNKFHTSPQGKSGAPLDWPTNGSITTYAADPYYDTNNQSMWKWYGLALNGTRQEFRDILFQKDWISDEERQTLASSDAVDEDNDLSRLGSWLSVCNHRNLSCSYEIDLYNSRQVVFDGANINMNNLVHARHGTHMSSGEADRVKYSPEWIAYTNYTEIEINRFLPLRRANVFSQNELNKEYKNTFYFRINLPEYYWWPLLSSNREGRNFSRFLIAFEYGGRTIDDTGKYASNNVFGLARNDTTLFDDIQDIKVTLNGFSLGETRVISTNESYTEGNWTKRFMSNHLYGPNHQTDEREYAGLGFDGNSRTELVPALYSVGERSYSPGFFEGGVYGNPFIDTLGSERSELIINEYKKDRFVTNLFRANTTYKVEETIHNGHVWLKITG